MSKLARISFVIFFGVMLGSITHVIGSGIFTIGMLVLAVLLGLDFYNKKLSPAAKVSRGQAEAARNASLGVQLSGNQGVLYVYREGSALGAGLAQAAPDGLAPIALKPRSFARWILPAGEHFVRAEVKGTNVLAENLGGQAAFMLAAGEQVFFQLNMAMDLKKFSVSLHRETDATVAMSKLARLALAGEGVNEHLNAGAVSSQKLSE